MEVRSPYYRTSAKALILDETRTKFLITKEDAHWELPGGGMDFGETPQETIVREIKEEMNLPVTWVAEHPAYFTASPMRKNDGLYATNIIYETTVAHLEFTPSPECLEIAFINFENQGSFTFHPNVIALLKQFDPSRHQR